MFDAHSVAAALEGENLDALEEPVEDHPGVGDFADQMPPVFDGPVD